MILLIDNYDSFVHNLARYFRRLGQETLVVREDQTRLDWISDQQPRAIVLSPGPCSPREQSPAIAVVRQFWQRLPILGICLGHQQIGFALGGVIQQSDPVHGQACGIFHDGRCEFAGMPTSFDAARYHSLVVSPDALPDQLEVTARSEDGLIMGIRAKQFPVVGWQFHPESILTRHGLALLAGFLQHAKIACDSPPIQMDTELSMSGVVPRKSALVY